NHCTDPGREAAGAGWAVRRHEGTARGVHDSGVALAGRRARLGGSLSDGGRGRSGGASACAEHEAKGRRMNGSDREDVHRAVERVARESYGRLVAYLTAQTRDVGGAEDALSEALLTALRVWPRDGVPRNPEAWLLTAARHSVIDAIRHQKVVAAGEPTLVFLSKNSTEADVAMTFPDERLKLLFVCAHP